MRIGGMKVLLIMTAVAFLWTGQALAAPITTLFNTGVDNSNTALSGSSVDPHYVITAVGDVSIPVPASAYVFDGLPTTSYPLLPDGPWVANTTKSMWIAPTADTNAEYGPFTYSTTFNLTGLDPKTALITGWWASDDEGSVYLNGNYVGDLGTYSSKQDFSINSFFVSGTNTLDFVVINSGGGPTGLQVQMSGSANAVPVPPTLLLLAPGLVGLVATRRRFKK